MINYFLNVNVLNFVQEYGILVTILMLAILLSYMIIRNSTKRIHEQEKKIDSLYGRIDNMMTKITPEEDHELQKKFNKYAENANQIQIQIYHLLGSYHCERVSIYEYHNGGKNLAGVEFKKCSNTYEAVSLETKPIIKGMQNLPLSINPIWSRILALRIDLSIPDVKTLNDDFLRIYLQSQDIKSYYSILLQDYANYPIGFIILEYYNNPTNLTQQQLDAFNAIAIKISVLINLK